MSDTGIRIKKLLDANGMTITELARKTGLNHSTISRYISGKVEPKRDSLEKIAHVLFVDRAYLEGNIDLPDYLAHPENHQTINGDFHSFQQLNDDYKKEVERYIEFLLKKQKEQEDGQ